MPRCERRFDLVYDYYRYNDGDGQCGQRAGRRSFDRKSEAVSLARSIQQAIAGHLEAEDLRELENSLLPSFGYFTGVRVERLLIDRKEVAL